MDFEFVQVLMVFKAKDPQKWIGWTPGCTPFTKQSFYCLFGFSIVPLQSTLWTVVWKLLLHSYIFTAIFLTLAKFSTFNMSHLCTSTNMYICICRASGWHFKPNAYVTFEWLWIVFLFRQALSTSLMRQHRLG